jgi:uncharacterized protein (DUF3084 family)
MKPNPLAQDILSAIEANLPSLAASQLKEVLNKASEDAENRAWLETELKKEIAQAKSLQQEVYQLKTQVEYLEAKAERVEELEKELREKLQTIEIDKMTIKLDAANQRCMVVEQLVGKVFGHPYVTVGKTSNGQHPGGVYFTNTETVSTTETKV